MTNTSLKNLDWIRGEMWTPLLRMEAARVRRTTSYYEEDGVSAAQTVKGFADHLLAKSTNRWRKIKWNHQRGLDFHSLRDSEIEPRLLNPTSGERGDEEEEEALKIRFVLNRILPPAVWVENEVVLEQEASARRPLRMDAIQTDQNLQKQMEHRYAHASSLELCIVRRDIHEDLASEVMRQLTCIDINWGTLFHQILLEEEEFIHHSHNLLLTGVEFGLTKLFSTESATESLKDQRQKLESEVESAGMQLREMQLKLRDLQESVKSDWDVLTWNNKVEKDSLLERKEALRDAITRAARLLRNSFLWEDYDSMPIEPDIQATLQEEVKAEEKRKEEEEFNHGESVKSVVLRQLKEEPREDFGYPQLLIDVDKNLFEQQTKIGDLKDIVTEDPESGTNEAGKLSDLLNVVATSSDTSEQRERSKQSRITRQSEMSRMSAMSKKSAGPSRTSEANDEN